MSKKYRVFKGEVTNLGPGENWIIKFQPFYTDLFMMAIVKVEKTEIKNDVGNNRSTQITVECKALDSLGFVYEIYLFFVPETVAKRNKIVAAMKKNAIFMVKGRYSISKNDYLVVINEPKYIPLPKSLNEKEIRRVFKVNANPLVKIH